MSNIRKIISNSPYLMLVFGFLIVIIIGSFLLSLPISSTTNTWTHPLTALFTATSATCVTGLIVVDTGTYFSPFGQVVIMLLIQIGGIGIMAFATLCIQLFRGKISLKNKINIQETYNSNGIGDSGRLIKSIFLISLITEVVGAIFLSSVFIPEFGFSKGLFYGLFHSISAFNNAGFDLMGNFTSLTGYTGNFIINITTITLITIGSLGFLTILDILSKKRFRKFSLTTKIVLCITITLLISGFILFSLFEFNNIDTLGNSSVSEKILGALFLSVTPRTAGFNTLDMSKLTLASSLLTILFMYIGASPTSTGGGLKTTTVLIPILSIISIFKGKEDIEIFERRVPKNIIFKSLAIMCVVFMLSFASIILLSITENSDLLTIFFEVASAINTVGLSLGLTPSLSSIGKIIICILMFIGRIGPLTIVLSLSLKKSKDTKIKFIEEKIMIG